jgi:hypothetical protein
MSDLRYPIGPFDSAGPLTATERAQAIRTLAETPARLRLAVSGLSESQLDVPYRPEGWTVRQVVHHVADSHMHSYIRVKFALSQDSPTIKPYPEHLWAEMTDGKGAPIALSLDLLEALHARWVMLLCALDAAQFARTLVHPERGEMTLDDLLALYDWHSRHHTAHITELRARKGW